MQKIKNIYCVDPEKNVSQTNRQTDRWTDEQMNRTNLIGTLLQRWWFDYVFQKFEHKIFLNYLV